VAQPASALPDVDPALLRHLLQLAPSPFEHPAYPLFHYTSPGAFRSILESRALRLTNAAYLNDPAEVLYPVRVARELIAALLPDQPATFATLLRQLAQLISTHAAYRFWYLASFTERRDNLGLWQAYCRGGGYAVGFTAPGIAQWARSAPVALGRVIYGRAQQKQVLRERILLWLSYRAHLAAEPLYAHHSPEALDRAFTWVLFIALCRTLLMFKRKAFRHEREWRLVSFDLTPPAPDCYFDRGGLLTPFVKLRHEHGQLPLSSVVVGPIGDVQLASHSGELLLKALEYPDQLVRPSTFTLRG
jgi:hypothetical protein